MIFNCSADLQNYSFSVGVPLPNVLVASGDIQRFHIQGEKRGSTNGWYVVNFVHSVCRAVFGSWRTGEKFEWSSFSEARMSVKDRYLALRLFHEERLAREKRKVDEQVNAAERAERTYQSAQEVLSPHPYLISKNISPVGVRQVGKTLVLPIYAAPHQIVNLQYIWPDGRKRFVKGAKKKGCYGKVGRSITDDVWLCEGYATAVSLYSTTGQTAFLGLDADNLVEAARTLKTDYPNINFRVAADDDRFHSSGKNVGLVAAKKAQSVFGSRQIFVPQFNCTHSGCTDFNDLMNCPERGRINECF